MKDKFKTEEKLQRVTEEKRSVPPLNRDLLVFVEKVRPVFEGPTGERRGPPRVKVVLSRGKGFVALTPSEAAVMAEMIGEVLDAAKVAEAVCAEEKKAWARREDEKYQHQPGPGVGVLTPGKTERDKKKRQAKIARGELDPPGKRDGKQSKQAKESKKTRKEKRKEKRG